MYAQPGQSDIGAPGFLSVLVVDLFHELTEGFFNFCDLLREAYKNL